MKGKIFGLFLLTTFVFGCNSNSSTEEKAPQPEIRSIKMVEDSLQNLTVKPLDEGPRDAEEGEVPPKPEFAIEDGEVTNRQMPKPKPEIDHSNERVTIKTEDANISLPSQGNNPVEEIKTEYQKSIPIWNELKEFNMTMDGCNVEMTIGLGGEVQTLNFNLKDLDRENKSVFEDDDFRPGMRIYTKNHEKKIKVKINGKNADPTDVLVMKLAKRENVANVMFAFLDLMDNCQ